MEYSLNAGEWNSVFAVPSSVVDKYIKLASGNSLKLLLYLTRHGGESFTGERLKAELGFEELGELEDAALFWVQRGVIKAENTSDAMALSASVSPAPLSHVDEQTDVKEPPRSVKPAKPAVISNGEIARSIRNSPEIKMLFAEAEKMYARPLRENERQTIIQMSEHYGLPCEVSLMLLSFCFKLGKSTPAYISKIAENWANDEILTAQLADERIRALEKQNSVEKRIRDALGLSSNLTAANRAFIKTWAVDWGFGEDMIMLAYDKTVDGTGKWSFPYANRILENWKNNGVATPQAAEKADEEFKKANSVKNNARAAKPPAASGKASSFDTDKLKSRVMKNYKK